jgi:hypothetical protein
MGYHIVRRFIVENDKKLFLSMAGEFRVCSELLRRGIFATVTYGNQKGIDIYAINGVKIKRIEVKTSFTDRFVTNLSRKNIETHSGSNPDIWVLCTLIEPKNGEDVIDQFYIFTHKEIMQLQTKRNNKDAKTTWNVERGVDNLVIRKIENIEKYKNKWNKITD